MPSEYVADAVESILEERFGGVKEVGLTSGKVDGVVMCRNATTFEGVLAVPRANHV